MPEEDIRVIIFVGLAINQYSRYIMCLVCSCPFREPRLLARRYGQVAL